MLKISYRISFFLILIVLCYSCKKKSENPPEISFISETGYTTTNRIVPIGLPIKIGIHGQSQDAPITNFVITLTTENGTETALDSGLYTENFSYIKNLSYGASAWEKWTFTIMDKNRKRTSTTILLTKDTASVFGPIKYFPSIILGCNQNTTIGSFFNPETGIISFANSSDSIQNDIYMILYYATLAVPPTDFTLGSPSDADVTTYYPNITNWNLPKNEVRYKFDSLTVSPAEFDAAYNDSLIISNYTSATVGKRKAKSCRPGYVIPFQISVGALSGKRGLIKIISLNGQESGLMEFALKIQQ